MGSVALSRPKQGNYFLPVNSENQFCRFLQVINGKYSQPYSCLVNALRPWYQRASDFFYCWRVILFYQMPNLWNSAYTYRLQSDNSACSQGCVTSKQRLFLVQRLYGPYTKTQPLFWCQHNLVNKLNGHLVFDDHIFLQHLIANLWYA